MFRLHDIKMAVYNLGLDLAPISDYVFPHGRHRDRAYAVTTNRGQPVAEMDRQAAEFIRYLGGNFDPKLGIWVFSVCPGTTTVSPLI